MNLSQAMLLFKLIFTVEKQISLHNLDINVLIKIFLG
jgi:hypothetical protein